MNGIARVFHGDYIAPSGRNGAQINMKHFYEGELRGKDMDGFGRLMYDSELFVGYMAVEHYDHNSQIDKKALGGHGAYMRAQDVSGGFARYQLVNSGIYRQDTDFTARPCQSAGNFSVFERRELNSSQCN